MKRYKKHFNKMSEFEAAAETQEMNTMEIQEHPTADVVESEVQSENEAPVDGVVEETQEMNQAGEKAEAAAENIESEVKQMCSTGCSKDKVQAIAKQCCVFATQGGKCALACAESGLKMCKTSNKHTFATGMFVGVLAFSLIVCIF